MHPDECEHGNTHIEGVNECVICQRDQARAECEAMRVERDEWHKSYLGAVEQHDIATRERDALQAEVERIARERDFQHACALKMQAEVERMRHALRTVLEDITTAAAGKESE